MELNKKEKNLLGRFAAGLARSLGADKPWLSTYKVRMALEEHPDLVKVAVENGIGCMIDDAIRTKVVELVNAIPEPVKAGGQTRVKLVQEKREAIVADLTDHGPNLSLASRTALCGAVAQGMKGDEKAAAQAELHEKFIA